MGRLESAYILVGVANFKPPPVWEEASAGGGRRLQEFWESGKLKELYAEELLWTGFDRLLGEARRQDIDISRTTTINIALSYTHELAQMTEDEVAENFRRRLGQSEHARLFPRPPRICFTPTHAASASGIVPYNEALADLLERGEEMSIVVAGGNTKGTNRNRSRISPAETTDIFASLVSPFDRKYAKANMLKLGASALGRAYQHDFDLMKGLERFVYQQRLFTHELARENLSTAHITTHPDEIEDRVIFYPVKLIGIAPQSMGYAGLVVSTQPPRDERAVRIVGIGCGVDASSIRDREAHLFSSAMASAVTTALEQARIPELSNLRILEHHNPYPAVPLTELQVVLNALMYRGTVTQALLRNDVGVSGNLIKAGRSGGALGGHAITPTFIRLVWETTKQLRGTRGYSPLELGEDDVVYAGVSSVGGHHTFDGYTFLAAGRPERLAGLPSMVTPFDHDHYNSSAEEDLETQDAMPSVKVPPGMIVAFVTYQETKTGREYFGLARTPDGRDYPFAGPPELFAELLRTSYIGAPIRLSGTLQAVGI
ncbi:MAG: hypothetical protein ACM362_11510 [Candidatus Methylomirabilota bacterium]